MINPVKTPQPHFDWGQPTKRQVEALKKYVDEGGSMSIYGDDGIYQKLENWLSEYYKSHYVILTNTGTSALNSAYVGLGIQPGDEVIVPTYTFLATVTPLLRMGAIPVFADANPETGNISPEDIENKITDKTVAIAVTHMWGVPCDMPKIMDIAKRHNLKVVEDCSHAHFTKLDGQLLGTYGDVACFSIGAKKTLTSGEGGFMFTDDPEVYLRASLLGHFEVRALEAIDKVKNDGFVDIAKKYEGYETGFGENYRMHPYSAVMAYSLLESGEIFELIKSREESLRYFTKKLEEIKLADAPVLDENFYTGAMYGYKGRLNADIVGMSTRELVTALGELNMKVKMPDSTALHEKSLFTKTVPMKLGYENSFVSDDDKFPGVEAYLEGRVSLPTFTRGLAYDKEVIDEYIRVFKEFENQFSTATLIK